MLRLVLVTIATGVLGCGSKEQPEGLPPATDWSGDPALPPSAEVPPLAPQGEAAAAGEEEPPTIDVSSDQPIDPAHRVRGTLRVAKAVADRVKPDGVIYLMAKQPDAAGKPTGTAMAVDRITWMADGQPFELGGATGEVLVIARYDQDADGITAQAGDVVGMTRVKVPADDVVIELSTLVP